MQRFILYKILWFWGEGVDEEKNKIKVFGIITKNRGKDEGEICIINGLKMS